MEGMFERETKGAVVIDTSKIMYKGANDPNATDKLESLCEHLGFNILKAIYDGSEIVR